jgi:hypothetical protein
MFEAFSDIAGEAAEYFFHGSADFKVGADIYKGSGAVRYMYNPPLDGHSIDDASEYYVGLDEHYSAGVYNKAFYILATTSGWNVEKAFKVFAHANQYYWGPTSTFINGACGVIDSAGDLSYDEDDVDYAFMSVGVDCPSYPPPPQPTCQDICLATFNQCMEPFTSCNASCGGDPYCLMWCQVIGAGCYQDIMDCMAGCQ